MPKNLIAIVRSMLDSGSSVEEIVSALKDMGIPEEDARKLIILANREILLSLRNELRDIVVGVLDEEREKFVASLRSELRDYVETQMKIANRNLLKMLREETGKYLSELTKLEEKVEILDRRLLDLEKRVYHREESSIHFGSMKVGKLMALFGVLVLLSAFFVPLDLPARIGLAVAGLVFAVGGVILG